MVLSDEDLCSSDGPGRSEYKGDKVEGGVDDVLNVESVSRTTITIFSPPILYLLFAFETVEDVRSDREDYPICQPFGSSGLKIV